MSKKINPNIKQISNYLIKVQRFLRQHVVIIFIVSVLGIYSFLVFQINQLASVEPSSEQITEQLNTIKRPQIDQETIDKIEQLKDQNVGVQSLFKSARDNPFQDN